MNRLARRARAFDGKLKWPLYCLTYRRKLQIPREVLAFLGVSNVVAFQATEGRRRLGFLAGMRSFLAMSLLCGATFKGDHPAMLGAMRFLAGLVVSLPPVYEPLECL